MLIERFFPTYDFHEVHRLAIVATPERVFQAIKEVTVGEVAWLGTLFGLRALPALLVGRTGRRAGKDDVSRKPLLVQMLNRGFVLLEEKPNQELVVGTIGQFWKLLPGSAALRIATASEFLAFDQPGYARAVMNFQLEERADGKGVMLTTETRILSPDAVTRRKFARYWLLIYPGSALIRRMWLRAIKRRAEG
jgi:hypothetical protein